MKRVSWLGLLSILASLLVLASAEVRAEILEYQFYDLGASDGVDWTFPEDINDAGCVLVSHLFSNGAEGQFCWNNGKLEPLPVPDGTFLELAYKFLSDANIVGGVGTENEPILSGPVFVWDTGYQTLPLGDDCELSYLSLYNISANGLFGSGNCNPTDHSIATIPTLYDVVNARTIGLGLPEGVPEYSAGYGYAVNNSGIVAGFFHSSPDYAPHGYIFKDGKAMEVFNAIGGLDIGFEALNNHNRAVGSARDADYEGQAIAYDIDLNATTILGPGVAWNVNDRGWACGADIVNFNAHPVVYIDGQTTYLSDYIPTDWDFTGAFAISNFGWIIGPGYAYNPDAYYGWLLVPIYSKGDYDGDDDVDFQDFGKFQECFAAEAYQGPEGGLHVGCSVFDFDDDVDLDLADYAAFHGALTGPTAPDLNPTGPG